LSIGFIPKPVSTFGSDALSVRLKIVHAQPVAAARHYDHLGDKVQRRARKFIGTIATICFVVIYALLAMAMAQSRIIQTAPGIIQALYYIVLGLAWILPLMPLIKWMERPDEPSRDG